MNWSEHCRLRNLVNHADYLKEQIRKNDETTAALKRIKAAKDSYSNPAYVSVEIRGVTENGFEPGGTICQFNIANDDLLALVPSAEARLAALKKEYEKLGNKNKKPNWKRGERKFDYSFCDEDEDDPWPTTKPCSESKP